MSHIIRHQSLTFYKGKFPCMEKKEEISHIPIHTCGNQLMIMNFLKSKIKFKNIIKINKI